MIGHLAFPAIDPQMLPAAVSRPVITDLLRTDLGFDGLVLTDAMNMLGAEGYGADKAVEAGADIILAPKDTRREIKNIIAAMERGDITEPDIDMHLRRILFKEISTESRIQAWKRRCPTVSTRFLTHRKQSVSAKD